MKDGKIILKNVYKKYSKNQRSARWHGFKDFLFKSYRKSQPYLRKDEFWALQDINIEIKAGESLGIIGKNGSGKTTLFNIISNSILCDFGNVEKRGNISQMLALGSDFNKQLTGYENVKHNLIAAGFVKNIDSQIEEIHDFSGLKNAFYNPVTTYSSGMVARLSFSTGISVKADFFLVDEVLAVGDIQFKTKCYEKISQIRNNGGSILLVSHNPHEITVACSNCMLLSEGKLIHKGKTDEVLKIYEEQNVPAKKTYDFEQKSDSGNLSISLTNHDNLKEDIIFRKQCNFKISYKSNKLDPLLNFNILIRDLKSEAGVILQLKNEIDGYSLKHNGVETYIKLIFDPICLIPSYYFVEVIAYRGNEIIDNIKDFTFIVKGNHDLPLNLYDQPRIWHE